MAALNKVLLIGNLGKDPELKYTQGGTAVCTFSLATTESYKDKDGKRQEKTEWHNIKIWSKQAEIAAEYLKKGKQIYIEGRIETSNWEKEGIKHYRTEIVVNRFLMLGSKGDSSGGKQSNYDRNQTPDAGGSQPQNAPADDFQNDDDLPF